MATVEKKIKEHDVVELLRPVGRWPAGTIGAVVSERGDWKLVEIVDDQGAMLDLVSVSEPELSLASEHSD